MVGPRLARAHPAGTRGQGRQCEGHPIAPPCGRLNAATQSEGQATAQAQYPLPLPTRIAGRGLRYAADD